MNKLEIYLFTLLAGISLPLCTYAQRTVAYDLYVGDTLVNYTGKPAKALCINGSIPAPALYFTEGDTAVIRVHNRLDTPTSIHWHGVLVPQEQDGVPYLTSAPVMPGTTHEYRFPVVQNGTYWYHSHAGLQEQEGLYGAFIVRKRPDAPDLREHDILPDYTLVLSDWTNEKAAQVNRRLHVGSDWYSIRKGSVQSYWEAIRRHAFKTKLVNEWKRMTAMDVSDVYYPCFLANGERDTYIAPFKAGQKVRLRIINGASSTYFWLRYAGGKITVVASDGKDVEPVEADRMIIAVSETYDVVLTVPEDNRRYQFMATAEDRSGSASLFLGYGRVVELEPLPPLDYFAGMKMMNKMMKMNGDMDSGGMKMTLQKMDMNEAMYPELAGRTTGGMQAMDMHGNGSMHGTMQSDRPDTGAKGGAMHQSAACPQPANGRGINRNESTMHGHSMSGGTDSAATVTTLNYAMLRSPVETSLPGGVPMKELRFELTGNMERYVWSLDNKTLSEADKIPVKEGENVRIILYNNTMMRHPMHLHGHFFRLKNGHGAYDPLKFTVDLMPMETDTIEFNADVKSRGNWYFHCHVLYHMMSGMGRIFRYDDSPPNPQLPCPKAAMRKVYRPDRRYYFTARNDFATNGNIGSLELGSTRWSFQGEWQIGYKDIRGYEAEARFGRYFGKKQWLFPYVGIDWRYRKGERHEKNLFGQRYKKDRRLAGNFGIRYTLPLLFILDGRVDTRGKVLFQLERDDIPLSSRLRMNLMANTDKEYTVGLRYILTPYVGVGVNYDSELKFGGGITLTY